MEVSTNSGGQEESTKISIAWWVWVLIAVGGLLGLLFGFFILKNTFKLMKRRKSGYTHYLMKGSPRR